MIQLDRVADDSFALSVEVEDARVERYACRASACKSPFCNCATVTLDLTPDSDAAKQRWPGVATFAIGLDPFDRSQDRSVQTRKRRERLAFGDAVSAGLAERHWEMLTGLFLAAKARALESLDPDGPAPELPFDEIERAGLMLAYQQVFPYAPTLTFELDEREYLADEQYCLKPDCGCVGVCLVIERVDGKTTERGVVAAHVDYTTGAWADERTDAPLTGRARRLADALLAEYPDLLDRLRDHHALLRRVYWSSRAEYHRPPSTVASAPRAKTGRNDPCPCGSGKKFKKCCAQTDGAPS